jgi:CRP-like cAMP-binding protein
MTDVRHFLIMKKCDLIQQLSQAEQYEVLKHLIPVEFKKEQLLIKEGDIVQGEEYAFFMITKGEVRVFDKEHGTLVTLYEGHSIGEMALINDKPRNASVKAITKVVTCMALTKNAFKNCCSTNDDFNKKLSKYNTHTVSCICTRKI